MKYLLTLLVALALTVPTATPHAEYLAAIASSLRNNPVYVDSRVDGSDIYTAEKLRTLLRKDDLIVLVMLPQAAETELGMDITEVATQLSELLGNQYVIGLTVGKKAVGYAPILPAGVAADQMKRAQSVSNDSITAISTFTQNVHLWFAEHPRPTPTPSPTPPPSPRSTTLTSDQQITGEVVIIVVLFIVALVLITVTIVIRRRRKAEESPYVGTFPDL